MEKLEDKEYKGDYTSLEYMAILISRELRDEDRTAGGGLHSDLIYNGILLATLTHAPNLIFATGGPYMNLAARKLPRSTPTFLHWEYRFYQIAEGKVHGHDDSLYMSGPRKLVNVFFVGGLQIDKYGNINNTVIGPYKKPRVRGSGPIGINNFSLFPQRYYLFVRNHDKRTLVDEVDFITAPGYKNKYGTREELGLNKYNPGPTMTITPMAFLDFDEETKLMRLKSVHPGYTVEDVVKNTGFDLILPEEIPVTKPPMEKEIHLLRTEVDRLGVLRKKVTTQPLRHKDSNP